MSFYPYQERCIQRIVKQPKVMLWLEMGMGKTAICLEAVKRLKADYAVGRVLVIAPLTVANTVWAEEAEKWHTGLKCVKVTGSAVRRCKALAEEADIYIINRENVPWMVAQGVWRWDMLIVDEMSSFKSPSSKRFKALRKVLPRIDRVVGLTGTPGGLMDLWSQFFILDQGARLGRTLTAYRDTWFKPGRRNGNIVYEYTPRPGAQEEIEARIGDVTTSLSAADYLSLPDRIDIPVQVAIDREQYDRMHRDLVLPEMDITAQSAVILMTKLKQIANGAVYDECGSWHETDTGKLEALAEIVESADDHVLIYYQYKSDYDRIMKRIKGAEPLDVDRWNRGLQSVALAHPASCGHGLNLQAGGSIMVWFGMPWSLEQYQQANARLYRQGQKKPVRIYHLIATGTVDEKVMEALNSKAVTQEKLIEAVK